MRLREASTPFIRYAGDDILVLVSEKYDPDAGDAGDPADAEFTINRAGKKEDSAGDLVPDTLPSNPSRDQRLAHRVTVEWYISNDRS